MKEIPLTQDKTAIVDDEDFERLNQLKWGANFDGYNWYAKRNSKRINGKRLALRMHRVIMDAQKGMQIDHINGDGLDNRKENLRLCTNQQNAFNKRHPRTGSKLGTKGVSWHKGAKKFQAQIGINGKVIYLGLFNVMGDADSAYRIAEEKYFGAFARTI